MRFALNTNCHGPRTRATQPTQHKPSCATKDMDFWFVHSRAPKHTN